jgi:hypothetical protein
MSAMGVVPSLWLVAAAGLAGLAAFAAIPLALKWSKVEASASYGPTR